MMTKKMVRIVEMMIIMGVEVGVNYGNGEEGWRDVNLEMADCEVLVRASFKALDVVFDD